MAYYARNIENSYSMSENARLAYKKGLAPKSKWTKKNMVDVILEKIRVCEREGLIDNDVYEKAKVELRKMSKKEIEQLFLWYREWHHVSKFANQVEFYEINMSSILEKFAYDVWVETHSDYIEELDEIYEEDSINLR